MQHPVYLIYIRLLQLYNSTLLCFFRCDGSKSDCDHKWKDGTTLDLEKLWFETSKKLFYLDAISFCENRNMQLIEIKSQGQWELVVNKLKSISENVEWTEWGQTGLYYKGWWGGATDEAEEGTWVWTQSGKPVGNFTWAEDQPDNHGNGGEDYFGIINWKEWNHNDFEGSDLPGRFRLYPLCQQKRYNGNEKLMSKVKGKEKYKSLIY